MSYYVFLSYFFSTKRSSISKNFHQYIENSVFLEQSPYFMKRPYFLEKSESPISWKLGNKENDLAGWVFVNELESTLFKSYYLTFKSKA